MRGGGDNVETPEPKNQQVNVCVCLESTDMPFI